MPGRRAASWEEKWAAVEHGTTYGMAQRCYKLSRTGICEACKKARAEYATSWRKTNPDTIMSVMDRNKARARALTRLAGAFPMEFQRFFNEEVVKSYAKELKAARGS